LQVKVEGESVEIVSGALTFRLDRKAAVLKRRGYRVLRNIRLAGNVDGQPEISRFERVGAQEMPDGCAAAWAEGFVGSLPVKVTFRFAPWSLRMDVEVQCQVNGQRIEGRRWDDTTGALKIVFEHGRLSVYRCHEPFELRQPAGVHAHAVQFFVTEWRDTASGFVTVLDRPSGLLLDDLQAAVALCRRGRYEYGDKMPDGEKIDNAEGAFTYRLGVVPFYAHELPDALREYQKLAYPLAITARAENRLGIEVQGHSVISGLCPEPDGSAALRVWNPLATDRFRIEAPGYDLARCRFDGTGRTPWAHDALTSRIAPMQFTQFLLRKRSRTRRANP
jgi:hypothetical protein